VRTSNNGTNWTTGASFTQALTVTSLGPFAGNSGANPAFTSRIDHFRVITQVAPDQTAPSISGISAAPSAIGAMLTWTTDEPASSAADHGPTTAYSGGTAGKQALVTSHALSLSGLSCNTVYHYRVRSRDAAGNETVSGDQSFVTRTCPTMIGSDEFNSLQLDASLWTLVDPVGDAGFTLSGTQARLSVPAGVRHDLWTGADEVPRLVQAAPNQNFKVEVKWDSAVGVAYQQQGLLVVQDADDLLRVETHHDGEATRLFIARIAAGVASVVHYGTIAGGSPSYFRLVREGNTFTLATSANGTSWTTRATFAEALVVRGIGPFAGNAGNTPPAFTSAIDYFRNIPPDVTPPEISGITAAAGAIGAQVAWTTDEPSTSAVAYGLTSAYGGGIATAVGSVSSHDVTLHGLKCETTYHFQVRGVDEAGNAGTAPDRTFTTAACPVSMTSDEFNSSSVDTGLWTFFNPLGDATAAANGSHATIAVPAGTAHDVWTSSDTVPRLLQPTPDTDFEVEAKFDSVVGTTYQQQGIIVEQDASSLLRFEIHYEGSETKLFVASITGPTAEVKLQRAVVGGAPSYLGVSRRGSAWTVRYSTDGEAWTTFGFTQAFTPTAVGPYAGNAGSSPPAFAARIDYFRVVPPPPPDTTAPALTSITALTHRTSATVTWSSDELSTSRVDWGATTAYAQSPVSVPVSATAHRLRLTGLSCGTTYHYRVRSSDAAGNEAVSSDRTFATASCGSGPSIAVWNGSPQTFGTIGVPQRWINILGNVEDPDGVAELSYRLNGSQSRPLSIGPSDDRLAYPGDFNVELFYGDLMPGTNAVEITAADPAGNTTVQHVQVNWQGNTGAAPSPDGPVVVLVAHPDDEALGMAGIIDRAKRAGRRVYVVIVTNGSSGESGSASGYCGAESGDPATSAAFGLSRHRETTSAMGLLGVQWTSNLATTEIIFLGYPQLGLVDISQTNGTSWQGDSAGLHRTWAEDFDGSNASCNGDFRYLLDGHHSNLTAEGLSADLDDLLRLTQPSDIYTHAGFDGHPDHAKVYSSLAAAIVREDIGVRVHTTLIHPEDTGGCQIQSAAMWPNPVLTDNNPFARFTPSLDVTSPPLPPCETESPTGSSWGPEGAPNELVEVPASMQSPVEASNLKWQVISRYASQIDCSGPEYHVNCGYMRAFVKKHEFFWTRTYSPLRRWQLPYTADWTSASSATQLGQVMDGQWTFDGRGIRPVSTGFDRLVTLGDTRWANYEVTARITFNSLDTSRPSVGSAAGLAVGWQGHTAWGQPRFGHPSAGLCLYAWDLANPLFNKVQLGYSPGEANDTVVATNVMDLTLGREHIMRFRHVDLGNGSARYSCKVWPADHPEPSAWTVQADIPYWPNETATHPGSVVLVAHMADATFGAVTVTPVGG
jgi:LmbE family N-acetylglucosaminyl deacetylase/regulation of enolase protein 1 (concanavalin A-like superfamily)